MEDSEAPLKLYLVTLYASDNASRFRYIEAYHSYQQGLPR